MNIYEFCRVSDEGRIMNFDNTSFLESKEKTKPQLRIYGTKGNKLTPLPLSYLAHKMGRG